MIQGWRESHDSQDTDSGGGGSFGTGGLIAARHDGKHEAARPLAVREIAEKLDGKETNATAVEVTLEPGEAGISHRHPGPALGMCGG